MVRIGDVITQLNAVFSKSTVNIQTFIEKTARGDDVTELRVWINTFIEERAGFTPTQQAEIRKLDDMGMSALIQYAHASQTATTDLPHLVDSIKSSSERHMLFGRPQACMPLKRSLAEIGGYLTAMRSIALAALSHDSITQSILDVCQSIQKTDARAPAITDFTLLKIPPVDSTSRDMKTFDMQCLELRKKVGQLGESLTILAKTVETHAEQIEVSAASLETAQSLSLSTIVDKWKHLLSSRKQKPEMEVPLLGEEVVKNWQQAVKTAKASKGKNEERQSKS